MDTRVAARVAAAVDRWRVIILLTILAALSFTATTAAIAKPYWHDEIYTILVADLPSISAMWGALRDGVDLVPPLSLLLTRASMTLFGTGVIAPRLPALLGFLAAIVIVFAMVRARANATIALIAALVPFQTAAYRYSYEARPYGLWIGFFALSLFAWTEAARGRRRPIHLPLLAAAFAASIWSHYYAVLTVAAVCLGEVVRQAVQRRIDWPMWTAIAAAGLMTLPLAGLLQVAAEHSASNFWTQSDGTTVQQIYWFLLRRLGVALYNLWGAAVIVALLASIAASAWRRKEPVAQWAARQPWPLHEVVAFTAAASVPAALLIVANLSGRPFTERYSLPGVVGVALLLPLLLRWITPRGSLAEVVLCAALLADLGGAVATSWRTRLAQPADPVAQRPLLAGALTASSPLAASGSLTFLQFWYYAPPAQRDRFVYLADRLAARQWTGSDTFDRGYLALARWTPVPVKGYAKFVEQHAEFRVYAAGSGWLLDKLHEDGLREELLASEPGGRLFRIIRGD
jgi:hypothetical protein